MAQTASDPAAPERPARSPARAIDRPTLNRADSASTDGSLAEHSIDDAASELDAEVVVATKLKRSYSLSRVVTLRRRPTDDSPSSSAPASPPPRPSTSAAQPADPQTTPKRHHRSASSRTKPPTAAAESSARKYRDVRDAVLPDAAVAAGGSAMYWYKPPLTGRMPARGLRAHTATLVGSTLWLFGGMDNRTCFRDVWKLDLDTHTWSRPRLHGDSPPPTRAHTATAFGKRIYIVGGGGSGQYFNSVYCLDTVTGLWSKPSVVGTPPSPRRAHAAILFKRHIVIFGGGNGYRALNDCWALALTKPDRLEWKQLDAGNPPRPRGYHTMTLVGNKAIVYGGSDGSDTFADVCLLGLEELAWTTLDLPAVLLGQHLVILCGYDGSTYCNDVLFFDLVTKAFVERTIEGVGPSARGYATANLHDGRMICIGGHDGSKSFDDVHCLELGSAAYLAHETVRSSLL